MMDALVSIVVTCYNHESYVKDCLESIFQQTYKNIELLVFNDGSLDDSDTVIKDTLSLSPFENTQYFYHENKGVVLTRNIALEHVSGDYLVFVDSDDTLKKDYIRLLVETAEKEDADIVYSALYELNSGEVVLPIKEYDLQEMFIGNFIHASSLIRTSAIGNIKFDELLNREKLEDYDFYLNLVTSKELKVVPCYETGLNYRMSFDSRSSHQNLKSYYKTYGYIIGKYLTRFPNYVKEALDYQFERLTSLDIEHSIKEEKISIYFSENEAFSDIPDYQNQIQFQDEIEIPVVKGKNYIRIRPSNIPSFYEFFVLKSKEYQTEILPILSNGLIDENSVVFEDFYPFLDYQFTLSEGDKLVLSYKRYNINDIVAKDYIGKLLAKQKYNRLQTILSYEQKQRQFESELNQKTQEFDDLSKEYNTLLSNYRSITNSIWWKIPTKIINFFRRKK